MTATTTKPTNQSGYALLFNCPDAVCISKFKTLSFAACLLELHIASRFSSHLYLCNPEAMPRTDNLVRGELSHPSNNWLLCVYLAYSTGKRELTDFPTPGSDLTRRTDFSPKRETLSLCRLLL